MKKCCGWWMGAVGCLAEIAVGIDCAGWGERMVKGESGGGVGSGVEGDERDGVGGDRGIEGLNHEEGVDSLS
jgi:hypothetical protein